ncbi:MAG: hypothetical protein R6X29_01230 [Acidimicrobiia bacterium]|jgi:hypothetical protein
MTWVTTSPVEIQLPALAEWGLVARSVILAYAGARGASSTSLDELGMACGHMWEEVADSPGVVSTSITATTRGDAIHLVLEGTGNDLLPGEPRWLSPVSAAVVGHVARRVSVSRSNERVRIEADLPLGA